MKSEPRRRAARASSSQELDKLRLRLSEVEATLLAIRTGEVDSVVVEGKTGPQVFTLKGAEHAYRVLIESMHEGALTLTSDKTILYANQCFANLVKCPLEQVTGSSLRQFLSTEDRATVRALLKQVGNAGSKIHIQLNAGDSSHIPVQISIRPLVKNGFNGATFGVVVTDLTESRRNEEMLRSLSNRLVQAQEAERGRVAMELHDHITQLLCAIMIRYHTLAKKLSMSDGSAKKEAMKLRDMLGKTAEEVERISRNLRPSVLEHLGLVAVLRDTSKDFSARTGVPLKLNCAPLTERLPADTELALYRILQEALKNVEKHAHARHVTVHLTKRGDAVQLMIRDDGIGFNPERHRRRVDLGLLGMRERATYVGGTFKVKSIIHIGTEIEIGIPTPGAEKAS